MMLMQGKKAGYSLMEVLAVVAIVVFLLTVGLVNYLKVRDRQRLENTARELIVYFNSIAQKARLGNRGGDDGYCSRADEATIAKGNCKLSHWQIANLPPTGHGNTSKLEPKVYFYNKRDYTSATDETVNKTHNFTLPQDVGLSIHNENGGNTLVFDSLYGLIYVKNESDVVAENEKTYSKHANAHFILTDGDLYYVFLLENGTFTHGCFCENIERCKTETC